jgi:hypothetical protein
MGIDFEDASKPVAQRENEFRGVVAFLAKNLGAVKSYTIAANKRSEEDVQAHADADKRKMAEAGDELEPKVTVRTRNEKLEDGSFKVYLWATKKIQRKAKTPTPVAASAPAATKGK